MTTDRRYSFHSLAVVLALAATPITAQGSSAVFSDTVDVEVVNIEIVVTDKDGQPVTGLTVDDFRLFEDGEPVRISNFYEVAERPRVEAEALEGGQEAERPARPSGGTQALNLVIFIDNLNILPSNRKLLFDNLRDYLRTDGGEIDQVMVVSMQNRIEVTLPFTSHLDAIHTALDTIEGYTSFQAAMEGEQKIFLSRLQRATTSGPATGGPVSPTGQPVGTSCGGPDFEDSIRVALDLGNTSRTIAEQRYMGLRATISTLTAFSSTLGGLPGRKALLFLSDGLSVRPNDMLREAWAQKYESWYLANERAIRSCPSFPDAGRVFQNLITGLGSSQFDLHEEFDRFAANASDNQVTLYPISVSGRGASIISAEGSGTTGAVLRAARTTEAQNRDASMLQMAADTGGVAMTNSPNIGNLLDRVGEDFEHFYSLGYQPAGPRRAQDFHRIKVEVTQPDLEVRHSKGRRRKGWRERLGEMTAAAAMFAIETNPLGVRLTPGEPVRQGKQYKLPIMVQIPFQNIQLMSDGSNYNAQLTVLVTVSAGREGLSDPQRFDLPIQIPNAQILAARSQAAAYPVDLLLDRGQQQVAIAVRDHLAQSASVVSLPVQVGDVKGKKKRRKKG
jgi:VWFA-related protein